MLNSGPESQPHHVVWLRQDLRIADNTALTAACANPHALVTAIYIVTPGQWRTHDVAAVRIDFELRHLVSLAHDLAALNIALVLLHAEYYADIATVLKPWLLQHNVSELHANRQYEVNELARDEAVSAHLALTDSPLNAAISSYWHEDLCIIAPGRVLTGDSRYYTVFTPFKRNWLQQLAERPLSVWPEPLARKACTVTSSPIPTQIAGFSSHVSADLSSHLWPVGEQAAHERLQAFIDTDGAHYDSRRNLPAINGTSTLSAYLAAGILSARQCLVAAWQGKAHGSVNERGLDTWISELCWRDFYKHIVFGFPHVCRHKAFKRDTDALVWRQDSDLLQAWCAGRTGFPIVDAAMRQLLETGWMHNRLRMIVAMFLTKDLFIDWRLGERHFMRHLIDGDFSANNGGWQWSASTGNDAAPYFRIFNPFLQSAKCDPEGSFIRHFVPELATLDNKRIHEPYAKDQGLLLVKYPRPMVDHKKAREFTLAQFKAIK